MSIAVRIPGSLREYSGVSEDIRVAATTVAQALDALRAEYPELYRSVCDETGAVRRHINLFVNSEMVAKHGDKLSDYRLQADDILTIWTAVSGG